MAQNDKDPSVQDCSERTAGAVSPSSSSVESRAGEVESKIEGIFPPRNLLGDPAVAVEYFKSINWGERLQKLDEMRCHFESEESFIRALVEFSKRTESCLVELEASIFEQQSTEGRFTTSIFKNGVDEATADEVCGKIDELRRCTDLVESYLRGIEIAKMQQWSARAHALFVAFTETVLTDASQLLQEIYAEYEGTIISRSDEYGSPKEFKNTIQEFFDTLRDADENSVVKNFCGLDIVIGTQQLEEVFLCIRAIQKRAEVQNKIGRVDTEMLEQNRLQFGSKGAHLVALSNFLHTLSSNDFKDVGRNVMIPPFELLGVDVYRRYKAGEDIDDELRACFEKFSGTTMMVRSSAVYSEDGEKSMGAGIYDTCEVSADGDFEAFKAAVIQVYESVDTDHALEYRRAHGVEHEEMGIVVQQKAFSSEDEWGALSGYFNSQRPYAPTLQDVVFSRPNNTRERALRLIVKHGESLLRSYDDDEKRIKDVFYFKPDLTRMSDWDVYDYLVFSVSRLAHFVEHYFGHSVQGEFLYKEGQIALVQAREIPKHMVPSYPVEFPDENALYESCSFGAGDVELDVLNSRDTNTDKKGVLVALESSYASVNGSFRTLPREGAVILLSPSQQDHGHFETLCAEKGLLCLFVDDADDTAFKEDGMYITTRRAVQNEFPYDYNNSLRNMNGLPFVDRFLGNRRVRIISDGTRARVYAVKDTEKKE